MTSDNLAALNMLQQQQQQRHQTSPSTAMMMLMASQQRQQQEQLLLQQQLAAAQLGGGGGISGSGLSLLSALYSQAPNQAGVGGGGIAAAGASTSTALLQALINAQQQQHGSLALTGALSSQRQAGGGLVVPGMGVGQVASGSSASLQDLRHQQLLLALAQSQQQQQQQQGQPHRLLAQSPQQQQQGGAAGVSIPLSLPVVLAQPEDTLKLSNHQVFLRQQIEAFEAAEDDISTHTRGRNKPITIGQVGIRCRHCSYLPVVRRQKGSTYFPASLLGLYQAAQNMCTTHMQCGLCTEMPEAVKQQFIALLASKSSSSGAGRPYWAKSAEKLGLVDTEDGGIRFARNVPPGARIVRPGSGTNQQQRQQQQRAAATAAGGGRAGAAALSSSTSAASTSAAAGSARGAQPPPQPGGSSNNGN